MTLQVRRLLARDDRAGFSSGNLELDRFFQLYAGQNQFRHHVGVTYVAVDGEVILGFATVTASEITVKALPRALRRQRPHFPLPVLRLVRLAVHERCQGLGVGRALLRAVFALALRMGEELGCVGVVVDAKPGAVPFYEKLGFAALDLEAGHLAERPQPRPMFLPLSAIARPG